MQVPSNMGCANDYLSEAVHDRLSKPARTVDTSPSFMNSQQVRPLRGLGGKYGTPASGWQQQQQLVSRDANTGHQLAGGSSSCWCPGRRKTAAPQRLNGHCTWAPPAVLRARAAI